MHALTFDDQPSEFPTTQVRKGQLKPMTQVLLQRRATSHFRPDPVPEEHLEAILRFAAQAPSGYNLQPWRFVVVRDAGNRRKLQSAAFNQEKVDEAPVVVVAFALKDEWKRSMDPIFQEGVRRGVGSAESAEKMKGMATQFLDRFQPAVWLNRHTMIAVTTMMLVAESYGLNTAPMEGFEPQSVKELLGLPREAEVVAMLAIGFAREPYKRYGGRLALKEIVFEEHYGNVWTGLNGGTQNQQTGGPAPAEEPKHPAVAPVAAGPPPPEVVVPKCPSCGMPKNEWPGEGYSHDGENYCCQGCAEDTGCTCMAVAEPGFSGEGQKRTQAKPRPGEQRAGAPEPAGELSGERDAHGTEEAIDQSGVSASVAELK